MNEMRADTVAPSLRERIWRWFEKNKGWCEAILTALLLGGSLGVLLYYITGPAVGYFHSDCTDSLLWSQIMVESGQILSEDFYYAAILPFGSPFWMVPILKLFGYTMRAQMISMAVFAILFVGAALFLFRSLKFRYGTSAGAVFALCMLLSGSVKIREIMWEHVIYYSLGIFFWMLLVGLSLRFLDSARALLCRDGKPVGRKELGRTVLWGVLLLLLCMGCATDGFQMLALSVVPVAGAYVLIALFDGGHKLIHKTTLCRFAVVALMGVGTVVGYGILKGITHGGEIHAGYATAYSTWTAMNAWWKNAVSFPEQYLSLIGLEIDAAESLFSMDSIFLMLRMVGAVLILLCPVLLLVRYRSLRHESSKVVLWSHGILSVIILLGFVCGKLSVANWRLVPMVGSGIVTVFVYVRELFATRQPVCRRVAVLLAAVMLCCSVLHAGAVMELPSNTGAEDPILKVRDTLVEKGYTKGYAEFWQSQRLTVLADSQVHVAPVTIKANNGVTPYRYQSAEDWYEDVEGQETYFLLLTGKEYRTVRYTNYYETLRARRTLVDAFVIEDYYVLVFDGNVFLSE